MKTWTFWLAVGFLGQASSLRGSWCSGWSRSEKRDSVVPVAFWWLSLMGGTALLSYATWRRDPVIIIGQTMGLLVYVRNLMLVGKARRRSVRQSTSLSACTASNPPASVARTKQRVSSKCTIGFGDQAKELVDSQPDIIGAHQRFTHEDG